MSIYGLQYIISAMKKLEKMDEVKKPSSKPEEPSIHKEPKISTPIFLLLCHLVCVALFLLALLADWAFEDAQAQNITGTVFFLLPIALAAAVILRSVKIPAGTRLSSPAFILCCFLAISLVWIVVYSQFGLPPITPADTPWKEYVNNIKLSVFVFGMFYTAVDSAILFLFYIIRWIVRMMRGSKKPANKK